MPKRLRTGAKTVEQWASPSTIMGAAPTMGLLFMCECASSSATVSCTLFTHARCSGVQPPAHGGGSRGKGAVPVLQRKPNTPATGFATGQPACSCQRASLPQHHQHKGVCMSGKTQAPANTPAPELTTSTSMPGWLTSSRATSMCRPPAQQALWSGVHPPGVAEGIEARCRAPAHMWQEPGRLGSVSDAPEAWHMACS